MTQYANQELLRAVSRIACDTGALVMRYFEGPREARKKEDKSPVTDADIAAHHYIAEQLERLTPEILLISEEGKMASVEGVERFWLVDPIDGTKSFVRGSGYFTVNIALIENHRPTLGVINVPQTGESYAGLLGAGAWKWEGEGEPYPIEARVSAPDGIDVMVSHSHFSAPTESFLNAFTVKSRVPAASSVKFCVIAEGKADLYPRHGPTMEWDTAAGHAILLAAGGEVETEEGTPLRYGKPDFRNPYFLAWGKR